MHQCRHLSIKPFAAHRERRRKVWTQDGRAARLDKGKWIVKRIDKLRTDL
jgi:hypothetical protein